MEALPCSQPVVRVAPDSILATARSGGTWIFDGIPVENPHVSSGQGRRSEPMPSALNEQGRRILAIGLSAGH